MFVRFSHKLMSTLLALAVLTLGASSLQAQTAVTWLQGATGNWNATANWTGLVPPDLLPNNGANSYTVTIPGVAGQANTTTVIFDNTTIAGNTISLSGLTLSSALNQTGNNSAELVLGAGVTLNAGNLTNFSGSTLSGGRYFIDGTLRFNGANIQTLASGTTLIMNGPAAQVLNQANNVNALSAFNNNAGVFDIRNGFNFNAATGWTNTGTVSVSEGSIFAATGNFTNSGVLLASGVSGVGTINLNSATVTNTGGTMIAGNNGILNVNSSAINGGILTTSGNGYIAFNNSSSNNLNGVTLNGKIDVATATGQLRVTGGLTTGAGSTININNGSVVSFQGDNTLSGSGSIIFGTTGGKVAVDVSNATFTIGSGVTIRGQNGVIGQQHFNGTGGAIIANNGVISADVSGGTIDITQASVSNNNVLEAKNGGTLQLSSNVTNGASGQLTASNNGTVRINGVTVTGGELNSATGGKIAASNSSLNAVDNVTVNGVVDLASSTSQLRSFNNLAFGGGSINIDNGSVLAFTGNSSTSGNGTITFGSTGANKVAVDISNSVLTLGANTLIHGQNGTIGQQQNHGTGGANIVNNGRISADVNGGTITLAQATVTNNNVLEAKNGGLLNIQTAVTGGANGVYSANSGGVVQLNGSTITGGTIQTASGGRFTATNNSSNFLNDVKVSGGIDLATNQSGVSVSGSTGMTLLNGADIALDKGSILAFAGPQLLGGSGTVTFGPNGVSRIAVDKSGAVLTIGSGVTVHGQSGTIGAQWLQGTGGSVIQNDGRISSDVAGGLIDIVQASVVNNGVLEAKNGGTLRLSTNVTGNVGSQISAGAGSVVLANGVTLSGIVNSTGSGSVRATNSANNYLNGVTLTGTLDLATATGSERSINGMTLNGVVSLDKGSALMFEGTQSLNGSGTITFGPVASRVGVDISNSVLTIGNGITIRGENGTVGNQLYHGTGSSQVINNGRISADVAGGTIEMLQASVTNNGVMEALNGGTLLLSSNITGTSTGVFNAGAGSTVMQNGVSVSGVINSSGGGSFRATGSSNNYFDGVTVNGNVNLAAAQSSERVVNGMVLNGNIDINNNSVLALTGTQTLSGTGTIKFGNTSTSNRVAVDISNSNVTIGSGILIHGENGSIGGQAYHGTGGAVVTNNGRIAADVNGGTIALQQASFANNNVLEAQNGGTLFINTAVSQSASGKINAGNNGVAFLNSNTITGGSITTSGGGVFRANNSSSNFLSDVTVDGTIDMATAASSIRLAGSGVALANGGTINIDNSSVLVSNGTTALTGSGSVVLGATGNNRIGIDISNSTFTIGSGVTIRGINGNIGNQVYVGTGNSHLVNNGVINSDGGGSISINTGQLADVVNNGTLRAQNGTLNVGLPLTGTGTLRVDAAGVMNMANAGSGNVQNNLMMGAAGSTLNTNNRNITINKDYTNTAAGTGNAFNRRAGINGTGQILAGGDAAQAITGANVTNGNTSNATLTIGNVRVGTTNYAYQVANTGTIGADLRGAIQTSVNGGNITEARLGGSGVTASNYGPVAVGTNSGNLNVAFTAASAGALAPLSGQAVNLRSNFDNIADQKLNIALGAGAAAYNAAVGMAASPVDLGNTRVGGTLAKNLNVANTAAGGAFSEKLDATFGANGGGVSNNGGSISLLAAQSTNNTSMGVSLNTATSGAKSGTATLNYVSNGTGTSGLSNISVGSQTVNVTGNVFQAAAGQLNNPPSLNFGTVQVGQNVSQLLSISNSATGANGFVEDLNAAFGSKTGTGTSLFDGTGSINGLVSGATNSSGMQVSVNTSNAGSINGAIAVNFTSAGAVNGVSNGLGTLAVGSASFGVAGTIQASANVVNAASPMINNTPINLGNVRINSASPSAFVSVSNQTTAAPQAALNATIAGNGAIAASGSFNLLNPGATNSNSLQVGMNTSTAGLKNGTATLGLVSDASNIGNCAPNCQMTLPSQNVAVNGAVYRLANPNVSSAPINLVARVGDASPTASVGVTNVSPDVYTERLNASFAGAAPTGFTTSGSITGLAAQGSSNALTVGLNTSTAGAFSGSAAINLVSSGAGTTNAADLALAQGSASLNGKVYAAAQKQLNTSTVDFGIVHVGDAVGLRNVSVSNSAAVAALNDVLTGDISGGSAPFSVSGSLGNGVVAGGTDNSSLNVALNTSNAGVYSSTAAVSFKSHNADMADLALGSSNVALTGTVNNYASAAFQKSTGAGAFSFLNGGWVLDFGSVGVGSTNNSASLAAKNSATGPADFLNGSFSFGSGSGFSFAGFNQFSNIGAGSLFANLGVTLNTTIAGFFTQTVSLDWFGTNASGYVGSVSGLQLTVQGNVTNVVNPPTTVPEPSTFVLMFAGLAGVLWFGKRRCVR